MENDDVVDEIISEAMAQDDVVAFIKLRAGELAEERQAAARAASADVDFAAAVSVLDKLVNDPRASIGALDEAIQAAMRAQAFRPKVASKPHPAYPRRKS